MGCTGSFTCAQTMTKESYTELEEAMRPEYVEEPNDSIRWIGWKALDYQKPDATAMLLKDVRCSVGKRLFTSWAATVLWTNREGSFRLGYPATSSRGTLGTTRRGGLMTWRPIT